MMHARLHARTSRAGRWPTTLAVLAVLILSASAGAHQEHKKQQRSEEVQRPAASGSAGSTAMSTHEKRGEVMDEAERNRSSMPFSERLVDWLGRLHPTIVHFPIAFFPAALFTALVGRRRPAFATTPVQFLVVAGGIVAPIAAVLGWLDALSADPGLLLTVHRWLGTAIGLAGLALAIWAWRRPDRVRGFAMIVVLSFITAAIVVQGWYGGALVHGIEHLNW